MQEGKHVAGGIFRFVCRDDSCDRKSVVTVNIKAKQQLLSQLDEDRASSRNGMYRIGVDS